MRKSRLFLMATTAVFATTTPVVALAQTADNTKQPVQTAADNAEIAPVIVTARKRSEDILKVPVSVSALTGADLATRDIESLDDVANFTPGMSTDHAFNLRTDRSFQQIIIRGLNPVNTANPTTSLFINGTPVGQADFIQNLSDVERVEVLKGPQSAYFGRETFAGAVNVVAASASNTLGGQISADVGGRDTQKYSAVINVPIFSDKLAVRAGYDYDSHDGSYKNAANPSQTLGDQMSKSVHLAITARPIENLTIKAFGMVFQDHDGPSATGIFLAVPGAAFNQSNCVVAGTPFFCGTLPGLLRSLSPAQNTTISPTVNFANLSQAFLAKPGGLFGAGDDFVGRFGLKRNAYHADLNIEYDLPSLGLSLTYLGAYNHDNWSEISDLGNEDTSAGGQYPGTAGFAFAVESTAHDQSHELRLATDQTKRYRALIGVSYVDSFNVEAVGTTQYGTGSITRGADSAESETTGVFFALAYDILPKLTINFDGRYQQDKESIRNPTTNATDASGTSTDFLPRVSLQYKITPDVMTYFTYSEGVNPGTFNQAYSVLPQASKDELQAKGLAGALIVKPENITNYELGLKGRFFGGRATLAADIYYDKWTNQLAQTTYLFPANDPANPYNVVGSTVYNPANTSPNIFGYIDNSAESTAKGLEVEANFIVFDHLTANLSGAINDTRYDKYNCVGTNCAPYASFNAAGKYLADAPKYSFAGGLEYSNKASMFNDAEWFARVDYIYRDGVYIQASNTVKTPDVNLVNVRAGLNFGSHVSVEGYVDNLFNDRAYTGGAQTDNVGGGFATNAILVGLPTLITAGVKLKYKY